MHYVSTRDADRRLTASEAIVEGLSRDGGLYLPEQIPQITLAQIEALAKLPGKDALIVKLIWTLQGNVRNLAYALNAIKEKMEA